MLQIEPDHDYAVLELGASRRGEIAALAALCAPTIGAITSVGDAHLGGFGSRRAIAEAKAELLAALPQAGRRECRSVLDGHAVLVDHPWLRRVADRYSVPVTWVGRGAACDVVASDVDWTDGQLRFRVSACPFCVPVWGRHHLGSALVAIAVGQRMGLPLGQIAAALAGFDPVPMRCEVTEVGGATIINDAYNASPAAMRAALELLRDFRATGRRVFVCGDMGELGDESAALHRRLGREAVALYGADRLIACGDYARHVASGARAAGLPPELAVVCRNVEEVFPRLSETISPGDVVLVKGSRAMGMERVVEAMGPHLALQTA
jgi:UDP-N-acetylmuramoyl-tripeptide--D-alanyl-D-alanine ligase